MTPQQYTESSAYLPSFLRDFHNQKSLFKIIWCRTNLSSFPKEIQTLGWVNFHILIIDLFLWWMAKRGYTLQRSRQKVEFLDLQQDIEEYKNEESEAFMKFLEGRNKL